MVNAICADARSSISSNVRGCESARSGSVVLMTSRTDGSRSSGVVAVRTAKLMNDTSGPINADRNVPGPPAMDIGMKSAGTCIAPMIWTETEPESWKAVEPEAWRERSRQEL